jgi:hypothetical protein
VALSGVVWTGLFFGRLYPALVRKAGSQPALRTVSRPTHRSQSGPSAPQATRLSLPVSAHSGNDQERILFPGVELVCKWPVPIA